MADLVEALIALDSAASGLGEELRWAPLTAIFVLASAWFVKWPLIMAAGCAWDAKRKCFPRAACAAGLAVTTAALLVTALKELFDRARPPVADPSLDPIGIVPASASFPSGHAATAFAAAVAVALVYPRLGRPLLVLAAVVAKVAKEMSDSASSASITSLHHVVRPGRGGRRADDPRRDSG